MLTSSLSHSTCVLPFFWWRQFLEMHHYDSFVARQFNFIIVVLPKNLYKHEGLIAIFFLFKYKGPDQCCYGIRGGYSRFPYFRESYTGATKENDSTIAPKGWCTNYATRNLTISKQPPPTPYMFHFLYGTSIVFVRFFNVLQISLPFLLKAWRNLCTALNLELFRKKSLHASLFKEMFV